MIHPNELRIGNWVNYPFGGHAQIRNGLWIDDAYEAAAFPIPITPEILEKCGIKRTGNFSIIKWFMVGPFVFYFEDNFLYWEADKSVNVQHLHQLQNLYFALTGKELNYKP